MNQDPLRIISVENASPRQKNQRKGHREELQAQMEWRWKHEPESFNPLRDWFERTRLERTLELIQETGITPQFLADLGCGAGVMSDTLTKKYSGVKVDAVDIASLALERVKALQNPSLLPIQDYIPHSQLQDEKYDLVLACELIGYLQPQEQRLFFSEIARIATLNGHILVSTRIDLNSSDALERLNDLADTELLIKAWRLSYHRLGIRCLDFFKAPEYFVRGASDTDYRQEALKKRDALSYYWYKWNSNRVMRVLWKPIAWLTTPFANWLEQRGSFLGMLEKLSKALWQEEGISHATFIAQRRPLSTVQIPPPDERPLEHKGKRFVWE